MPWMCKRQFAMAKKYHGEFAAICKKVLGCILIDGIISKNFFQFVLRFPVQ
jgi:hypothetical protein